MIDLKDYFQDLIEKHPDSKKATVQNMVMFLENNHWFGSMPEKIDGKVILTDEQIELYADRMEIFLTTEATYENILKLFERKFPMTASYWKKYAEKRQCSDDVKFHVCDFLLAYLTKDLALYSDSEASQLINLATLELIKAHGTELAAFMNWLHRKAHTNYYHEYRMEIRYEMTIQNQAYSMDEYLELMFYIFNEDYIDENEMYRKAAQSKDYTDIWLYFCMHYICSLRTTDLERIYHPDLPYPPNEVLEKIADGSFSDADAQLVLLSITVRLASLHFTPSKTLKTVGINSVKITFPHSCEAHFGRLFALAEAHRQVAGKPDEPIIRRVTQYSTINRVMGDEIGSLFLKHDFRSRSATKSYLQSIFLLADQALDADTAGTKGYVLASLARSHKSGYGSFAETTIVYLKDMALSKFTPEFVVYELMERGVLSFIPGMLLDAITDSEYSKMSVPNQTQMIKTLALSPFQVENIIAVLEKGRQQAKEVLAEVIQSGANIMTILQRISSGQAFAKESECLCLNTACGNICPYPEKRQCIGCRYEISTKSTLILLAEEYKRIKNLYETSADIREQEKYKYIITNVIVPKTSEILSCLRTSYGDEYCQQYEEVLRRYIS